MQHLVLSAVCLIIAGIFIAVERAEYYVAADVLKGLASALFVVVGVLGALGSTDTSYVWCVVAGLALGAIADVLLNLRYVFVGRKGQLAFLVGILVFFIGHLVYVVALAQHCKYLLGCIVVGILFGIVLLIWIFRQITAELVFKIFGVFYICTIAVMNVVAICVVFVTPTADAGFFACGAILFLVSDILLILNTFGSEQKFSRRIANLMLYYMGQLLIALSLQLVP